MMLRSASLDNLGNIASKTPDRFFVHLYIYATVSIRINSSITLKLPSCLLSPWAGQALHQLKTLTIYSSSTLEPIIYNFLVYPPSTGLPSLFLAMVWNYLLVDLSNAKYNTAEQQQNDWHQPLQSMDDYHVHYHPKLRLFFCSICTHLPAISAPSLFSHFNRRHKT